MARHDDLARRFERFADQECSGSSPLYELLSREIAKDAELLELASRARAGQPPPNLLFASVQFLLLKAKDHPLAAFAHNPFAQFQSFCLRHRDALVDLLSTRLVQTNEVRRCAALLPAFGLAQEPGRPMAFVEIGASAGLNLLWDHYAYDYGGRRAGRAGSPVEIGCDVRGAHPPPLSDRLPAIVLRAGIDLHPLDVGKPDDVLWLRSLIWPEHSDRVALLERAAAIVRHRPPTLIRGDALDVLPRVLAAVPADVTLCVFHTHTLNQFAPEARKALFAHIADAAATRPLVHVSLEWFGGIEAALDVSDGRSEPRRLATFHSHGKWIEWRGPNSG